MQSTGQSSVWVPRTHSFPPFVAGEITSFDVAALKISVAKLMEEYRLKDIGQQAIDAVAAVNVYLTEEAPWKIKGDGEVRRWV